VIDTAVIDTAVIPAAGLGKRVLPISEVVPKEMLPIGNIPMIEYTIKELCNSGIKRICVVINRQKEIIKKYIHKRKPLFSNLEVYFAYQKSPLGLGGAIRCAKNFIGKSSFVMAIPDQILFSDVPATKQLLEVCRDKTAMWSSMVKIPRKELIYFKGSRPFRYKKLVGKTYIIYDIEEETSRTIRGFGRTIFPCEALDYMTKDYINEKTSEIDLLKTFKALLSKVPQYGVLLEGKPCDIGSWEGYLHYMPKIKSLSDLNVGNRRSCG
jgi:UTP--glucose-1-phosphate uridylyltransferase